MKKIALICVLAALVACSRSETAAEREAAEAAAVVVVPNGPYQLEAGTYSYTRSDGVSGINTLAADGTFSNAVTGGAVEKGKWAQEGELGCLIPDGGAEKRCYRFSHPDHEGLFTGVMADGLTVEVRKVT
ncbi:hypothetical protein [Altererythrobacter sp. Root672]|uniref:hypothetical protein n=1 Tax=Altererythrobacter sp. Root672 TaxID=1736584 RepID=UPI0006FFCF32|nr:hypothetical protein [Altererythrobacter sp. Root672]KRA83482.1 hypothetical protein ASD76_05400 [Altererythrobacter sp. Root672]